MDLSYASRVVASLVFSNTCETCDKPLSPVNDVGVCQKCAESIAWIHPPACGVCGRPMLQAWPQCAECVSETLCFDRAFSPALYEGTLKSLLHAYKFKHRSSLKKFFTQTLIRFVSEHSSELDFDSIVAVPADSQKLLERGFNPASLLSASLAAHLKMKDLSKGLRRIKQIQAQSLLSKDQRRLNVMGCFETLSGFSYRKKRVLLVDDILTTGQTASECTRVLKNAGAASVQVLTVARGL